MSRPLLGISCCLRSDEEPVHGVIDRYVRAAALHAHADIVLLPALGEWIEAASLARRLDGLLLTGSPSNVGGQQYGRPDAPGPHDPARDASNFTMIDAMIAAGKPVFGICRGHQEINVAFGGTLRDIEPGNGARQSGHAHHAPAQAPLEAMFAHGHDVALTQGGLLAATLHTESLWVNSAHYQAIDRLGAGLAVEATGADGTIEAISARIGTALILGVQWHPEWRSVTDPASIALFELFGGAMRTHP